jgi:site-specific recombinase XerC
MRQQLLDTGVGLRGEPLEHVARAGIRVMFHWPLAVRRTRITCSQLRTRVRWETLMGNTGVKALREPWNKGKKACLKSDDFRFPSRLHDPPHLGTRQCARILGHWVEELRPDRADYGTHSMLRTKATLIDRRTRNLRAVQLRPGHSKLESTVRYVGIEVDDALEIFEQTEIRSGRRPATRAGRGGWPRTAAV